MKIRKKVKKVFLVIRQLLKAFYYGLSPFFFIPGVLSKYPKLEMKMPNISNYFKKKFFNNIPEHFQKIYRNNLVNKDIYEIYDIFTSFFLLKNYIPNVGWVVIDIGAFKGLYSLICLDLIGDKGHVVVVEPNQKLYLELKKIELDKKSEELSILNCAISSKNEFLKLNISESFPSTSSISSEHTSRFDRNFKSILVEGITLDKLIERENLDKIDLVKIDVEGAELDVLFGAVNSLLNKKIKRFIIEVHQDVVNIKQVKKILKSNKYRIDAIIKTSGDRSFLYSRLK